MANKSVIFKRDVGFDDDDASNIVFKKGSAYEVLGQDTYSIFVNSKPNTKECSQIPKSEKGTLYDYA